MRGDHRGDAGPAGALPVFARVSKRAAVRGSRADRSRPVRAAVAAEHPVRDLGRCAGGRDAAAPRRNTSGVRRDVRAAAMRERARCGNSLHQQPRVRSRPSLRREQGMRRGGAGSRGRQLRAGGVRSGAAVSRGELPVAGSEGLRVQDGSGVRRWVRRRQVRSSLRRALKRRHGKTVGFTCQRSHSDERVVQARAAAPRANHRRA